MSLKKTLLSALIICSVFVSGSGVGAQARVLIASNFSQEVSRDGGISTDSEAEENVWFDYVRNDLHPGVRIETTHLAEQRISSPNLGTFHHSGFFVSNFIEDGYGAEQKDHPFLIPIILSLCGTIAFVLAGFMVWRHVPKQPSPTGPADEFDPAFWREVVKIYRFPIVMFSLAYVPGVNLFAYSGHGGIAWFFLPLCFPWVLVRILVKIARGSEASSKWYKRFLKITVPSYVAAALPLSWVAVTCIHISLGLEVSPWGLFALVVSPFPWWYFGP
jgi:hypothetical protein